MAGRQATPPSLFPGNRPRQVLIRRRPPLGIPWKRNGSHAFVLSGQSQDSTGAALVGVTVDLFRTGDNSWVARTVSDGTGAWSFVLGDNAGTFYTREDLAGAPDLFGTSSNNLVAV